MTSVCLEFLVYMPGRIMYLLRKVTLDQKSWNHVLVHLRFDENFLSLLPTTNNIFMVVLYIFKFLPQRVLFSHPK